MSEVVPFFYTSGPVPIKFGSDMQLLLQLLTFYILIYVQFLYIMYSIGYIFTGSEGDARGGL